MNTHFLKYTEATIRRKYHVLFWIGYFSFNVIRWGSYFDNYWYSFKSNLVEFPLHIIIVYVNLYYFIPRYLLTKRYSVYIIYLLISLLLLYVIRTGLNYVLVTKNIWPEAVGGQQAFIINHFIAVTIGELYVVALATAIKLTVDWIYEKDKNEALKAIQLKTELEFLKAQIQPHFFFNTLNSLYALTLEKSSKAPETVLKLSEIMEYILYEAKAPTVSIHKEIRYIQNYIDLETLRHGSRVITKMQIEGNIVEDKVPPLLYLSFIENCFKHGIGEENKLVIVVLFKKTKNGNLKFKVINNCNPLVNQEQQHGIGNENIKRRLALLFKDRFSLQTMVEKNNYVVELTIPV
ncbi:sensor histidine kinase [Tenacibaculum maritimum]|uniref:sensor histidine kinase n=1 Tax=Tenacibaculum maritimum TaxID=107401 RepID=UPI00388ECCF8